MKGKLPLLAAVGSLAIANASQAAIGWTLEDCEQHWGDVVETRHDKDLRDSRPFYFFQFKGLDIIVAMLNDKVTFVRYINVDVMANTSTQMFLNANPSESKLGDWKGPYPAGPSTRSLHPTGNHYEYVVGYGVEVYAWVYEAEIQVATSEELKYEMELPILKSDDL
jgi:hypothetical protein